MAHWTGPEASGRVGCGLCCQGSSSRTSCCLALFCVQASSKLELIADNSRSLFTSLSHPHEEKELSPPIHTPILKSNYNWALRYVPVGYHKWPHSRQQLSPLTRDQSHYQWQPNSGGLWFPPGKGCWQTKASCPYIQINSPCAISRVGIPGLLFFCW